LIAPAASRASTRKGGGTTARISGVDHLRDYLEHAHPNAVNFPDVVDGARSEFRVGIANSNLPTCWPISTAMARRGLSPHTSTTWLNKSKGEMAYTLVDGRQARAGSVVGENHRHQRRAGGPLFAFWKNLARIFSRDYPRGPMEFNIVSICIIRGFENLFVTDHAQEACARIDGA